MRNPLLRFNKGKGIALPPELIDNHITDKHFNLCNIPPNRNQTGLS